MDAAKAKKYLNSVIRVNSMVTIPIEDNEIFPKVGEDFITDVGADLDKAS